MVEPVFLSRIVNKLLLFAQCCNSAPRTQESKWFDIVHILPERRIDFICVEYPEYQPSALYGRASPRREAHLQSLGCGICQRDYKRHIEQSSSSQRPVGFLEDGLQFNHSERAIYQHRM